jgi:hypothetical protein
MARHLEAISAAPSSFWLTLLRCIVVGAALGVLSSLMVNSSLVEVSCSPFFASAFGLLFIVTAGMMFAQILSNGAHVKNRILLSSFALLNLFAGGTCFLLERDWSHGITPRMKVPFYALLGMCLAFSVNFSSLDLLARADCFTSMQLFVRTEWQVRVVAINAMCTGCFYGVAFGVLDVEDAIVKSPATFRAALNAEARICYPLGAASGALAAILARLLEVRAEAHDPDLKYARGADRRDNL